MKGDGKLWTDIYPNNAKAQIDHIFSSNENL